MQRIELEYTRQIILCADAGTTLVQMTQDALEVYKRTGIATLIRHNDRLYRVRVETVEEVQ